MRRNPKLIVTNNKIAALKRGFLLLAASFSHTSHAFATVRRWKPALYPLGLTVGIGGKHFQLEELEDAEKAITDVLLNSDCTVTLGLTDGPFFSSSRGIWSESNDDSQDQAVFEMKLSRTYIAGENSKEATGIGEFAYEVERTYQGVTTLVGGSLIAIEGVILDIDEIFGSREVGFFNMIDTTEARDEDSV